MPHTDMCLDCHVAGELPRGVSHHNRSCRFSKCRNHCTCSRPNQRAWRKVERGLRINCNTCGRRSAHVCPRQRNGFIIGGTRAYQCSFCCISCADRMPCGERTDTGTLVGIPKCCVRCNATRPGILFRVGSGICDFCERNAFVCSQCLCVTQTSQSHMLHGRISPRIRISDMCGHNACNNCCRCGQGERPARTTNAFRPRPELHGCGVIKEHMSHLRMTPLNPVPRTIGVELEVAGFHRPKKQALVDLYNTCVKWHTQIGTDGSIEKKNGIRSQNGVEIRTAPAGGVKFLKQLYEVTRAINKANGHVNKSCGLHVHVGLGEREKYSDSLVKACMLWEVLEETVYKLVAPHRQENRYCQKITKSYHYTQYRPRYTDPTSLLHADSIVETFKIANDRYSGFNIQAARRHGTIEFRLYHACLDYDELSRWTLLCANMVDMALKTRFPKELVELVNEVGPARFLYHTAPTVKVQEFLRERLPAVEIDYHHVRKELGIVRHATKRRAA